MDQTAPSVPSLHCESEKAMAVRLAKVTSEEALRNCYAHGVWAMRTNRFKKWQVGDTLLIYVGDRLAAMGYVRGTPYQARKPLWKGDEFKYRIPMHWTTLVPTATRPIIPGRLGQALKEDLGPRWAFLACLAGKPLTGPAIEPLVSSLVEASRFRGRRAEPPAPRYRKIAKRGDHRAGE